MWSEIYDSTANRSFFCFLHQSYILYRSSSITKPNHVTKFTESAESSVQMMTGFGLIDIFINQNTDVSGDMLAFFSLNIYPYQFWGGTIIMSKRKSNSSPDASLCPKTRSLITSALCDCGLSTKLFGIHQLNLICFAISMMLINLKYLIGEK